ncbi:hypothetical protein SCLCIDRAFT_1216648 [Scleroderma citrinum Foug A]|uniref:Uncharacterized protein n=1 Tax=Scleroderma citrinum Foug A TaxID=1036808 RepID=A0A0C2ZFX3_9AGAM|nr:hypothetical protein SCLCIDRAFT_1216648 [Scleroderma citrinum Foug A]
MSSHIPNLNTCSKRMLFTSHPTLPTISVYPAVGVTSSTTLSALGSLLLLHTTNVGLSSDPPVHACFVIDILGLSADDRCYGRFWFKNQ